MPLGNYRIERLYHSNDWAKKSVSNDAVLTKVMILLSNASYDITHLRAFTTRLAHDFITQNQRERGSIGRIISIEWECWNMRSI